MSAGTSTPRFSASAASAFAHRDTIDAPDQSTTTHVDASRASSMTSSNTRPGGMTRSHHTEYPSAVSASASACARVRSAVA
jgi:hypothetical protein